MRINHLVPFLVCLFLSSQISQGLDVTTLWSVAWQHLTGCHLSLFSATTVSLLWRKVSSPFGCFIVFLPLALPSDFHLQNKNLYTGTGHASTAQRRTWPAVLTYQLAVAAGHWELDSAAGCNFGQQIQLLSPLENNKQLLLLAVRWHRRHDRRVTAASDSLLNCTGLSSAESCQLQQPGFETAFWKKTKSKEFTLPSLGVVHRGATCQNITIQPKNRKDWQTRYRRPPAAAKTCFIISHDLN